MKRSSHAVIAIDALSTTALSTTARVTANPYAAAPVADPSASPPAGPTRRVRDLRRFWRRALAILVPIPMLALAVGLVVTPYSVGGDVGQAIAGVAAHPSTAQAALWLSVIFALAIVPATMAVAWTSRRRAPWLTLAAGVSLLVAFGVGLPNTDLAVVTAATHGLDPTLVTALDRAVTHHPAAGVGTVLFLLGQTAGFVLLGIALWRARVLPAWLGIVLAASGPAHLLLAPLGNLGLASAWMMTAIAYVGAAVTLWRTHDADFDLAPLEPEGAAASADRPDAQTTAPSTSPERRDARTVWRWLLAIAAVPVPIFVAVFRFLLPYDGWDTPEQIFAKLVAAPGYQNAAIWLAVPVVLCGFAGALAVAWLCRRRTPVLTTVAMALAVPGYIALFAGGPFGDLLSYVTRTVPGLDYRTAFLLGSGMESSPQSGALGLVFVAGHLFGTTLLGVALWRARIAPTWLAIGLTVSQPIHLASVLTGIRPLDLLGWGLTAVGFAWAAWRLTRLPNDDFDLPPATGPVRVD
jgi:hypothetical protein